MKLTRALDAGLNNLAATYLALGKTVPGSVTTGDQEHVRCTSPVPYAVGNFAIAGQLSLGTAQQLRLFALDCPQFTVYSPKNFDGNDAVLSDCGFQAKQRLDMLGYLEADMPQPRLEMDPCDREAFVRFVTYQFFGSEPGSNRTIMGAAIRGAHELAAFAYWNGKRMEAAVNLARCHLALGLYNLCVSAPVRGQGIGTQCIQWAKAQAVLEGLPLVLQCDPNLTAWYLARGFCHLGSIGVFRLGRIERSLL